MSPYKPPASDAERLMNVLEALASDLAEEQPSAAEMQAEAEASGVDFEAWAAEIRAKVEARVAAERRATAGSGRGPDPGEGSRALMAAAREAPEPTAAESERSFGEVLAAQRQARTWEGRPRWAPAAVLVG
jgi:hypothetical protein